MEKPAVGKRELSLTPLAITQIKRGGPWRIFMRIIVSSISIYFLITSVAGMDNEESSAELITKAIERQLYGKNILLASCDEIGLPRASQADSETIFEKSVPYIFFPHLFAEAAQRGVDAYVAKYVGVNGRALFYLVRKHGLGLANVEVCGPIKIV